MTYNQFLKPLILSCFLLSFIATSQESKDKKIDSTKKATKELPLEPERKVSFTTNEGSWISLDVQSQMVVLLCLT